ncbi:hypothetical protein Taro_003103 [Colocasia esculenta]|uniref:Endonuclease/exonuclease/phosphatase domain-containing protein n=1 Tax=Colocasia esculenta TaxID=4460 RepID=A0A843TEK4_COLES|nr:hypothetical protein [Colocasia esculenta]
MLRVPTPPLPFLSIRPRWFRSRNVTCMGSTTGEPSGPTFVSMGGGEGIREAASERGFKFRLVSYNILAQLKNGVLDGLPVGICLSMFYVTSVLEFYGRGKHVHKPFWQSLKALELISFAYSAELVLKEEIEYNDLVKFVDSGSANDENKNDTASDFTISDDTSVEDLPKEIIHKVDNRDPNDPHVRLKRDCVGIMAAFRLNNPTHHLVIVANTHIYWDPEWADVKLAQAEYLLSRLSQFKKTVASKFGCTASVIVAGDFNSTPGDMVYQFLVTGTAPTRLLPDTGPPIPLCSLYASAGGEEPPFTNCTPGFTGTIDYIFLSKSGKLKPISLLQIPGHESIEVAGGLPNFYHPSDHLPIGGDFQVSDV